MEAPLDFEFCSKWPFKMRVRCRGVAPAFIFFSRLHQYSNLLAGDDSIEQFPRNGRVAARLRMDLLCASPCQWLGIKELSNICKISYQVKTKHFKPYHHTVSHIINHMPPCATDSVQKLCYKNKVWVWYVHDIYIYMCVCVCREK